MISTPSAAAAAQLVTAAMAHVPPFETAMTLRIKGEVDGTYVATLAGTDNGLAFESRAPGFATPLEAAQRAVKLVALSKPRFGIAG